MVSFFFLKGNFLVLFLTNGFFFIGLFNVFFLSLFLFTGPTKLEELYDYSAQMFLASRGVFPIEQPGERLQTINDATAQAPVTTQNDTEPTNTETPTEGTRSETVLATSTTTSMSPSHTQSDDDTYSGMDGGKILLHVYGHIIPIKLTVNDIG